VLAFRYHIKDIYARAKGAYKTAKEPPEHKCTEEDSKRKNRTEYQGPESNTYNDENEGIEAEEEVLKEDMLTVFCLEKKEDE
jgi:hypothetical protein